MHPAYIPNQDFGAVAVEKTTRCVLVRTLYGLVHIVNGQAVLSEFGRADEYLILSPFAPDWNHLGHAPDAHQPSANGKIGEGA